MPLTEKQFYQVEITENDHVQVRVKTIIYRDGDVIASNNNRHVIAPGQDYSGEFAKTRRMCDAAFTSTVIARHEKREALQALQNSESPNPGAIIAAKAQLAAAENANDAALAAEG